MDKIAIRLVSYTVIGFVVHTSLSITTLVLDAATKKLESSTKKISFTSN